MFGCVGCFIWAISLQRILQYRRGVQNRVLDFCPCDLPPCAETEGCVLLYSVFLCFPSSGHLTCVGSGEEEHEDKVVSGGSPAHGTTLLMALIEKCTDGKLFCSKKCAAELSFSLPVARIVLQILTTSVHSRT